MGIHVLIIEAESRFRKNLYECLQAAGFSVTTVTPRDDVMAVIANEKVDTILLGIDGLGRKGLSLIQPIQKIKPGIKIMVINDAGHIKRSIKAMELGAFDDFLIPLDIDSLTQRIREAALSNG